MLGEVWGLGLYPSCNQFYQGLYSRKYLVGMDFQKVCPAGISCWFFATRVFCNFNV
jgi:hypothetical protein